MIRRPPVSTRTSTLLHNTSLFRSGAAPRLDGGILRGPEGIGIAEIAILAKQVRDDARRALGVEQGVLDRDRLPAEQPCLQLVAGRDISIGIVVERQPCALLALARHGQMARSEEHTSELQSLMRISYAVFCLKKKKKKIIETH